MEAHFHALAVVSNKHVIKRREQVRVVLVDWLKEIRLIGVCEGVFSL